MPPRKRKSLGPYIDWWPEPEPVDLRVNRVFEVPPAPSIFPAEYEADGKVYIFPLFPRECLVEFKVDGKDYIGCFRPEYVSPEKMVLSAIICGDTDEGWFVRIPDETFQGGPQIIIPEHEKDTLIIRYPERMKHDLE